MDRPLLLNGFMATGKSTIGRIVAERSGRPFIDLDEVIEKRAGKSIAAIFREDGEARFRQLERDAVLSALEPTAPAPVVALGGGALLRRHVRLRALENAVVVTLHAQADTLVIRNDDAMGTRPLLTGPGAPEQIGQLLELRAISYAEAHGQLDNDAQDPAETAEKVLAIWQRNPVAVAVGHESYAVDIGHDIATERLRAHAERAPKTLFISDENVAPLHAAPLHALFERERLLSHVLPAGEEHKTATTLNRIWEAALSFGTDRKTLFIGLGGGVVTDVTGFAAATWMRGVDWVALPTTLLAMVDASVGGKTAVDLPNAKNAVGAFWQPRHVICDTAYIKTEPERGYRSALAEVVKTALIGDGILLERLEQNLTAIDGREPKLLSEIVERCVRVKASVVSRDQREGGLRASLNLGHTLGHALEAEGGYGDLTHGEAVSLGLVAALRIGQRRGVTPAEFAERAISLLARVGLPTDLGKTRLRQAVELLGHDKKRAGSQLKFVLCRDVGDVVFETLPIEDLKREALALVAD